MGLCLAPASSPAPAPRATRATWAPVVSVGHRPARPSPTVALPRSVAAALGVDARPVDRPALLDLTEAALTPRPVTITIPAIGVRSLVTEVGVDDAGGLAVPESTGWAAWYRAGPAPGQAGSAVVAAHVDYDGRAGVFFRLRTLDEGAEVLVTDAAGTVRTFVVTARRQFAKTDLAFSGVFRRTGAPVLTLITCGGVFRPRSHSYADNVVVEASLVT